MKLLLDTHILLWTLLGDDRLSKPARDAIADEGNDVYYSIVSPWEVEIKRMAHPDEMDLTAEELVKYARESGFYQVPIRAAHVYELKNLRRREGAAPHKDPFDRIMICQAIAENMVFVTHDNLIRDYEIKNILMS
ncbi:MAG: type II toxin-antitoxin system VapC family toxin [Selenomonadaceae bacterium]